MNSYLIFITCKGEVQMSRKTTKSILSRDEISLLRNSEILKDTDLYGNLHTILIQLSVLKAVTLDNLIEYGLDDKGTTILMHKKGQLIDSVMQEWYVESKDAEDPDKKVKCGLCNTPNKYLYYIRNRLSNAQLNVGSSCMTKFSDIEGYANHKYQLGKIQRNHQQTKRWLKFIGKFPEAENIIDSANFYFDNLPILLPHDIYFPLEKVVNLLHVIRVQYVKYGKVPNETTKDSFELFEESINEYNKLKVKSDAFISQNINKHLICKRQEIDWMIQNKKNLLLNEISLNNGLYTIETLGEITSITFIKQNFNIFLKHIPTGTINLVRPKDEHSSLYFTVKQDRGCLYNVNIKKFMKQIGARCFFDADYIVSEDDFFEVSKIIVSDKNVEYITELLKANLSNMNYALLIDDNSKNLYLYHKSRKDIKVFSYMDFLRFYDLHKIRKHKSEKDFNGFLITYKKWIPIEEQERTGLDEKVRVLYYQQYIEPYKP